ncbi:putative transporter C22E12.01 [Exophiala dermatitidis]
MDTPPYTDRVSRPASVAPGSTRETSSLYINPRRKYKRRGTGSVSETKSGSSEDEAGSSMSESEEHELGALDSESGIDDDEETGLHKDERKKYVKRKRRCHGLDSRIAGTAGISKEEAKEADKRVLHNLLINAALVGLWYFFSLSISIYNKMMFSAEHLDFHFPLFATSLHMLVQFGLASAILLLFPSFRPSQPYKNESHPPKPLVTPMFYLTRLVPTGTTTSLDIGLGNTSLRYITLTFYTMCKSSVLIFVLIFAFLFRLERPSLKLILIILTMTIGVLMMAAGETAFNALGFALAMSASFFSGFRWAVTQILLLRHPATSNPFATLFFLAPIMFVSLFCIACVSETPSAVVTGVQVLVSTYGLFKSLLLLIVPGCLAFCMIASEFTLLQRTSVVTLSICGILKEVVTISAAGIIFHDELSLVNITGLIVTIVSMACYNYLKIRKMREEALEKLRKRDDGHYDEGDITDADNTEFGAEAMERSNPDRVPLIRDQEAMNKSGPVLRRLSNSPTHSTGNGSLGSPTKRGRDLE